MRIPINFQVNSLLKVHNIAAIVLMMSQLVTSLPAFSDELSIEVIGVENPLKSNVTSHIGLEWISVSGFRVDSRRQRVIAEATDNAAAALRPFGYYRPDIKTRLTESEPGLWTLQLQINPGPPVRIRRVAVEISGPGAALASLQQWQADWPLPQGAVLNQLTWEAHKELGLQIAAADGYLAASYPKPAIELDLEHNTADLNLTLATGPQAVFGQVTINQDAVHGGILDLLPLFQQGDPYSAALVERFRLDLWKTGYFFDIEVAEQRQLTTLPHTVNLVVSLEERKRNTYQGTIGYGSDTQARTQFLWSRHLMSARGDSLDSAFGLQQRNREFSVRTNYRLPIRNKVRQFWEAGFGVKTENQSLEVSVDDNPDNVITLANGDVQDVTLRFGKTRVRDVLANHERIFETVYAQYLRESDNFDLPPGLGGSPRDETDPRARDRFRNSHASLALGVEWNWPEIRGQGFHTTGHHEQAWIFTANDSWGSDLEFSQAYISSRWNFLLGERWKVLLRAEAGASDANVNDTQIEVDGVTVNLSLTELPHLYRFFAGGSRSVRGYGFEDLSDNGRGSNNLVTGSVELEYNFRKDWSAAAFIDAGDAFNRWESRNIRTGVGVGLRWYTVAGAIRLDIAQARDIEGKPWRLHFTIGTPLL